MRPHGSGGITAILCPCISGSKTDDDEANDVVTDREVNESQKSPFLAKKQPDGDHAGVKASSAATCVIRKISAKRANKDDLSLPPTSRRGRPDGTDQDEITFEFERHSNASSMHQIPSLHTEIDLAPGREACSQSGSRARSTASRHSVDDVGSYRSVLRIDRTPSLSYCSEAGVAKSSSVLVNIPSSRGSLSSFGRWSARRSPSPDGGRKGEFCHYCECFMRNGCVFN